MWKIRASGGPDTPRKNRNGIPNFLRGMPVKVCKRWKDLQRNDDEKELERICEARIVDETKSFELDFVEKTEVEFWSIGLTW